MTQPSGTDKAWEMLVERLRKRMDDHRFNVDNTGTWNVPIRSNELDVLLTLPSSPLDGEGLAERLFNALVAVEYPNEPEPDIPPPYRETLRAYAAKVADVLVTAPSPLREEMVAQVETERAVNRLAERTDLGLPRPSPSSIGETEELRKALKIGRDYVSDAARGIHVDSEKLRSAAAEDLATIDAALSAQSPPPVDTTQLAEAFELAWRRLGRPQPGTNKATLWPALAEVAATLLRQSPPPNMGEGMVYWCPECRTAGDCLHRAFLNRAAESACRSSALAIPSFPEGMVLVRRSHLEKIAGYEIGDRSDVDKLTEEHRAVVCLAQALLLATSPSSDLIGEGEE